ncbi:MAG: hypothetical protein GY792_22300, partial [Gammaproteobacteria bacterium]|nr:hypothetical protein [Gammaproteobacteria bacterium]
MHSFVGTGPTRLETELQHAQRDLATAQKQSQKITLDMESQREKLALVEIASERRHSAELKDVIKATGKKNDQLTQQLEEERQALSQIKQKEAELRI